MELKIIWTFLVRLDFGSIGQTWKTLNDFQNWCWWARYRDDNFEQEWFEGYSSVFSDPLCKQLWDIAWTGLVYRILGVWMFELNNGLVAGYMWLPKDSHMKFLRMCTFRSVIILDTGEEWSSLTLQYLCPFQFCALVSFACRRYREEPHTKSCHC